MAYYRRRKSYGGSVSLIMTFLLGFALGMSVMYLFMVLIAGREETGASGRTAQLPDKPLNAAASLQHIAEGQGRYIVPAVSPDMLMRLWRNVITELQPAVVVLRMGESEDPRTVREALDLLDALSRPPVVLMELTSLVPPSGAEANDNPDAIPDRILETLRQWDGSGWLGPCLAYAAEGGEVSLFGARMTPEAAVRIGLDINRVLLEHGLAAVAWPFPGVGNGHSPEGYPWITEKDFDVLAGMVEPFLQAIQAGTPAVVAAQVVVPALDARRPPRPACASPVIIRELLREKWQYDGLILGDATLAFDIVEDADPSALPVRCLAAGCDAVLVDFDRQDTAVGMLMSFDLKSLPPDQLAASAERLERFRARYGGQKNVLPGSSPSDGGEEQTQPPAGGDVPPPEDMPEAASSTGMIPPQPPAEIIFPEETVTTAPQTVSTLPENAAVPEPVSADHPQPVKAAQSPPAASTSDSGQPGAPVPDQPAPHPEPPQTPEAAPAPSASSPAPPAAPPVPVAPDGPYIVHRIEPGEGLASIAKKYGVSLSDLKQWNGITDPDRIVAGTRLKIYGVRVPEAQPESQPTDTAQSAPSEPASGATSEKALETGASDAPTSADAAANNEIKSPAKTVTSPAADDSAFQLYVVQPGDTLSRIAGKYGISQAELMRINNIQDKNLVKIGSKIKVPVTAGSTTAPSTPRRETADASVNDLDRRTDYALPSAGIQ